MSSERAIDRCRDAWHAAGLVWQDRTGDTADAQAPGHSPADRSVTFRQIEGQVLVNSHADDKTDVLTGVGLTVKDLFDEPSGRTDTYPDGRIVHRSPDKKFRQSGNTKGRSLFRTEFADAAMVYVCEGEKDVRAVESVGAAATCSAMGAGKAHLFNWEPLRGKNVTVVADKDEPGRKHAAQVAELLDGIATSVRVMEAAEGKDAADHIAAGRTLDELVPVPTADTMPKLWRATDLKPAAQPRWLAKGRLPLASISLLVGDEGIGKSLLWVWIVAAVTTGKPLPEFGIPQRDPANVILVCTEDDWTTTVRPRLDVAGADLSKIQVICTEDDGSGAPIFPRDLFLIAEADPKPALVVVDAWLDTVPAGLSVRDPQQARQALHPWKDLATAIDAAVLLLCHTNRVSTGNARDKYGATAELRKKARMTLFAQQDDDGRLVVGPEKMNTAAPIPASTFTITSVQHFPPSLDNDGTVPLLAYAGDSDRTAREHIADNYDTDHGGDQQDRADAERWLEDYLREHPGAKSKDVKNDAKKDAGISERTLKRASKKLGVTVSYVGMPAVSVWSLANDAPDSMPDDPAVGPQPPVSRGPSGPTKKSEVYPQVTQLGQVGPPSESGPTVAQQSPPAETAQNPPVGPPVPDAHAPVAQQPPGGLTTATPGQTARVQQILAKANNRYPRCTVCGQPVTAGQGDRHLSCTEGERTA